MAVHHDARRERIVAAHEPAREDKPVARSVLREAGSTLRHAGLDLLLRLREFAAMVNVSRSADCSRDARA